MSLYVHDVAAREAACFDLCALCLRAEVERLVEQFNRKQETCTELRAEVERLRAKLAHAQEEAERFCREVDRAEAKLKAVVEAAGAFASPIDAPLCDVPDCKVCTLRRAVAAVKEKP